MRSTLTVSFIRLFQRTSDCDLLRYINESVSRSVYHKKALPHFLECTLSHDLTHVSTVVYLRSDRVQEEDDDLLMFTESEWEGIYDWMLNDGFMLRTLALVVCPV